MLKEELLGTLRGSYTKFFHDRQLTHAEKVLFVVAFLGRGIVGQIVSTGTIKQAWPKSLLGVVFHSKYILESEDRGWVERIRPGQLALTDDGLARLEEMMNIEEGLPLSDKTELLVFSTKKAHDFDSLLRKAFSSAKSYVLIADSYVDETIFDTLLGAIPVGVRIDLMYNHDGGNTFHQVAKRFKVQFPDFHYGHYPKLHDRYLVIDGIGFVIGPSLKDATVNAPAIVVRLDTKQSAKLITLFGNIYKNIKKNA
jgi:hypothetical protein